MSSPTKLFAWLAGFFWALVFLGVLLAPLDDGNLSMALAMAIWAIVFTGFTIWSWQKDRWP